MDSGALSSFKLQLDRHHDTLSKLFLQQDVVGDGRISRREFHKAVALR